MLLTSHTSFEVVLRTLSCYPQNARGAICTRSLTSELVDSRRLIIVLDRLKALGFVFSRDVKEFRVMILLRKSYEMLRIVMI